MFEEREGQCVCSTEDKAEWCGSKSKNKKDTIIDLRGHLNLELYAESNGKLSKDLEAENGHDHLF